MLPVDLFIPIENIKEEVVRGPRTPDCSPKRIPPPPVAAALTNGIIPEVSSITLPLLWILSPFSLLIQEEVDEIGSIVGDVEEIMSDDSESDSFQSQQNTDSSQDDDDDDEQQIIIARVRRI